MNNAKELIKLISENPELPVIPLVDPVFPLVDYEIVADDWDRWFGSFGRCYVGEYALYNNRFYEDREEFKEAYYDDNTDKLCEQFVENEKMKWYWKSTLIELQMNILPRQFLLI